MKMKFIPLNKRSKKEQKAYYAAMRSVNGFNTGTRVIATDKSPSRARAKVLNRAEMKGY